MPQRAIKQCLQSEGTCSIQYRLHSSQAFQPLGCIHTRHSRSVLDRYSTRSSRLRGGGRLYLYRASALEQQSPKLALPQPIRRPVVKLETSISLSGRASNNAQPFQPARSPFLPHLLPLPAAAAASLPSTSSLIIIHSTTPASPPRCHAQQTTTSLLYRTGPFATLTYNARFISPNARSTKSPQFLPPRPVFSLQHAVLSPLIAR